MLFQIRDDDPAVIERLEELLRSMAAEVSARGPLHGCGGAHSHRRARDDGCLVPAGDRSREQGACRRQVDPHAERRRSRRPGSLDHHAAGMLFVPSIGGISHHWTENTADADIVTGAEVFVDACRRLLAG